MVGPVLWMCLCYFLSQLNMIHQFKFTDPGFPRPIWYTWQFNDFYLSNDFYQIFRFNDLIFAAMIKFMRSPFLRSFLGNSWELGFGAERWFRILNEKMHKKNSWVWEQNIWKGRKPVIPGLFLGLISGEKAIPANRETSEFQNSSRGWGKINGEGRRPLTWTAGPLLGEPSDSMEGEDHTWRQSDRGCLWWVEVETAWAAAGENFLGGSDLEGLGGQGLDGQV